MLLTRVLANRASSRRARHWRAAALLGVGCFLVAAVPSGALAAPARHSAIQMPDDPGPRPVQHCSGWVQVPAYALEVQSCVEVFGQLGYVQHFGYVRYLGPGTSRVLNFGGQWHIGSSSGLCELKTNFTLTTGQEKGFTCNTAWQPFRTYWTRAQLWDNRTLVTLAAVNSPQVTA